jgi:hypothetical protein
MEKIVIHMKDKKRAQTLKNFLQTLNFVESVTQSGNRRKGQQVKYADFFSMASLWAGRRQEALLAAILGDGGAGHGLHPCKARKK